MNMKGLRFISSVLAICFGLLLTCKTSMELCPTFTAKIPSCHEQSQKPKKNCECSLSYTELKIEESKFLFIFALPSPIQVFFSQNFKVLSAKSFYNYQLSLGYSPPNHFIDTIRLTP